MNNWFDELPEDFDMSEVSSKSTGMDNYLSDSLSEKEVNINTSKTDRRASVEPTRIRVASVDQLDGFTRIANTDTLVRMSERDFWELKEDDEGELVIERLYDADGEPLEA